jgi:hypothetical protein
MFDAMMPSPDLFAKVKVLRPAVIRLGFATQGACDSAISFYTGFLAQNQYPPFVVEKNVCVYCEVNGDKQTTTTVYWEIAVKQPGDLKDAYDELINKHGCKGVEEPIVTDQAVAETIFCTLRDPADNLFGLVINPPRPIFGERRQPAAMKSES